MKRILLFIFVAAGLYGQAQSYNNEWISFDKTYFKFKVQPTGTGVGVYRITQAVLTANGLGSTPAEQFQLWRLGQEVPIYTSVATGPFAASDYIEFRAELNNGKMDKDLYRNPAHQLNDKWSFQSDSLTFFLTVNIGVNKRLVPTNNDVAGNVLPAEPYFMHTLGQYFSSKVNLGYAVPVGEYVYSSAYDQGEGFTSSDMSPGGFLSNSRQPSYRQPGSHYIISTFSAGRAQTYCTGWRSYRHGWRSKR